jgi:predicted lipoprotein with Yx(FWY)xxD motif
MKRALATIALLCLAGACVAWGAAPTVRALFNAHLKRPIVVDATGRTLYLFTGDPPKFATCVGDLPARGCGKVWPPLVASRPLVAGGGAKASLLGTTKRSDGVVQVTYAGHPLYFFRGYGGTPPDRRPGDINGQGLYGMWYVISPTGTPIRRA